MIATQLSENVVENVFEVRPAIMEDIPDAVELFNRCSLETKGRPDTDRQRIQEEWETPGFNLAGSTQVVRTDSGQMVGFVSVWDLQPIPVNPWVWGCVHPAYEGRGIGGWLLSWAEARSRDVVARLPNDALVTMSVSTVSTHESAKRLFTSKGMSVARRFWDMLIEFDGEVPAAAWPQSIRLSTFAERPDIRRVYLAVDEAFRDHWGYVDQPLEESVARWRYHVENDETFDPTLWFLAMDGDEIAGLALCERSRPEDPKLGWVNVLGVRRRWRRQGLALALLRHAFSELAGRGRTRAGLGVDATSLTGANRLYFRAGMHVHRRYETYEKVLRQGQDQRRQAL